MKSVDKVFLGYAAYVVTTIIYLILNTINIHAKEASVLEIENIVQTSRKNTNSWNTASKGEILTIGDRIRTRQRSRATIGLTGLFTVRLDQFTTIEITESIIDGKKPKLDLTSGAAFIFSREKSGEVDIKMPGANAALRGTQLFVNVDNNGKSYVQVIEGQVFLNNEKGELALNEGDAGEVKPGFAPKKTAIITAKNIIQWALYYPGVVDSKDIILEPEEKLLFAESLRSYSRGDLLGALEKLPTEKEESTGARLFRSAVVVAVGRVDEAKQMIETLPNENKGRRAIERMIISAQGKISNEWQINELENASELIAESYYRQSRGDLKSATLAARKATTTSPENGFAWIRIAELEFSNGNINVAKKSIEKAELFTPDSARLHALKGFVLSAQNEIKKARISFEAAVDLDGSFGNAWLGLGLTKIKQGDLTGGRIDLQIATTVEPTSSIFHSYLGKAMSIDNRKKDALKDLELAKKLDPNDPTSWLYIALEKQRNNRPNEAVVDLQQSIQLNDNRRLYRSAFLLDQDRAVRSANLAQIYQNAGMREVSYREAIRAVENDYTNPSAHLFLSNSYNELRDPDRTLLRYETPWFNELLLSNMLSTVGGGALSQFVSQEEYSKLLEADGIGGSIKSEWRSDTDTRATTSIFGTHEKISYGIDASCRNNDGDRPNSDFTIKELYAQLKWQPSMEDTFYFLGKFSKQQQGDLFQNYSNATSSTVYRFEENQSPGLLLGGWNHRWRQNSNTLILAGQLNANQVVRDPNSSQLLVLRDNRNLFPSFMKINDFERVEFTDKSLANSVTQDTNGNTKFSPELVKAINPYLGSGSILEIENESFNFTTSRKFNINSSEVQHIETTDKHTFLLGGRWQKGNIETDSKLTYKGGPFNATLTTPADQMKTISDFEKINFYFYDYYRLHKTFTFVTGASWDSVDHPENFRNPPVSTRQKKDEALSGKLGFTWAKSREFTLRCAVAEALGGLTYDESVRLEPSQISGFGQSFRTVISESLVGSVEAPRYSIAGIAAEGNIFNYTWWGASCGLINQKVSRTKGFFTGYENLPKSSNPYYFSDQLLEKLDYNESYFHLNLNQFISPEVSIGASWQITRSDLLSIMPELEPDIPKLNDICTLHRVGIFSDWNSPSGFFAHMEINFFNQHLNSDDTYNYIFNSTSDYDSMTKKNKRSGDDFFQINTWAGYRFNENFSEITFGVMNLGNTNYNLSALNSINSIPRERTFFAGIRLSF